ncbi:DUF1684 domain-containing protein [Deinococcus yavapaiensis]|uniref:DUF1684 domain-containing protein n=1 Tax=Deinococcus yavapaiensis KR-236 TaxID=694435 RepID=A0A318S971_9DEIO|nr:DUF1684 domain-containing protein [Deinococcus yavapaiensis]PYE54768.1 hypothetical protein DES52_10438 [Deinococcus yavapaiensis KR-236]
MDDVTTELLDHRRRKDVFFRGPNSPLPPEERSGFAGLAYFEPNAAYRIFASIVPSDGEVVELATTTGEARHFIRYGTVTFDVPEGTGTLTLFAPFGDDAPTQVFVPFRDATSGAETYETGRYVEGHVHGDMATLDFNFAYFPYCAYGEGWSCPIPPIENRLSIAIRAGERSR